MTTPCVSLLVPVCHGGAFLAQFLRSVRALQAPPGGFELILATDDSAAALAATTAAEGAPCRVVTAPAGASRPQLLNLAWRAASGQVLAFTDDDAVLPPAWLCAVATACARADEPLLLGGVDEPAPGGSAFGATLDWVLRAPAGTGLLRHPRRPDDRDYYPRLWNMALTRAGAERIAAGRPPAAPGLFDERFVVHEDAELAAAARAAGCRVCHLPELRVHHVRDTTWLSFAHRNLRMAAACRELGLQRRAHGALAGAAVLTAVLLAAAAAWPGLLPIALLPPALYAVALGVCGLLAAARTGRPAALLLAPPLLATLHASRVAGHLFAAGPAAGGASQARRRLSLGLFLALVAGAAWYLHHHGGEFRLLTPVSGAAVLLVSLCLLLGAGAHALQLKILTRAAGGSLSYRAAFGLARATSVANLLLPFPAGAAFKILYLQRVHHLDFTRFLAALFLANLAKLFTFSVAGCILLLPHARRHPFLLCVTLAGALGPAVCLALVHRLPARLLPRWRLIADARAAWDRLRADHGLLGRLVALNLGLVAVTATGFTAAYAAFGVTVAPPVAIVVTTFATYPVILRLVPGDLGVKELLFVGVASRFGLGLNESLHAAALHRALSVAAVFLLAPTFVRSLREAHAPPPATPPP